MNMAAQNKKMLSKLTNKCNVWFMKTERKDWTCYIHFKKVLKITKWLLYADTIE